LRAAPEYHESLPELLMALREEACAAGMPTRFTISGAPRSLGPQAEQAIYRAAQEGLTNAQKHARASHVDLTLDYSDARLTRLVVQDDGQGAADIEGGFGLVGLRERIHLLGGSLGIRTAPGAGFQLTVDMPG
jgi:signal transduction histidine kinase